MRSIVIAFDMSEKITCAMRFVKNPKGKIQRENREKQNRTKYTESTARQGKNKKYRLDKRPVQA